MNNRRRLLIALGVGALVAPLGCFAQQPGKVWRVGFLMPRRLASLDTDSAGAFPEGMAELGYAEGRNLVIEWRSADGSYERLPALMAELLRLKMDVIVANGMPAATAAHKAGTSVPIVMVNVGDPVGSGFVASLARPGGNMTGLTNLGGDVASKNLELLLSMVPKQSRVALLVNPDNPVSAETRKSVADAARSARVTILTLEARTGEEIERAFSTMIKERIQSVVVGRDVFFSSQFPRIARLAEDHRLPSISGNQEYAAAGGLMGYGSSPRAAFRRAATYVDRIFKGARPRDLPVEQPTQFDLVVNSKTARALGITIPQSILVRADRVIE